MATLKPPTPLLTPNKGTLKPTSPLHPKNAPKKPISHPQRRWRFQSHSSTSEQRRWRLQATGPPGRATNGRPTLQTSSNHRNFNRLASASVTNVVNPSPKTSIISEKADGLTTFVTTDQKSTHKTPPIDDVCNNTRRATSATRPHWCGGRRRDWRARACLQTWGQATVPVGGNDTTASQISHVI